MAALPENIRQEVIAEQFRLQRLQQQRSNTGATPVQPSSSNTGTSNTFTEVNPEFLAALPLNIQEEVLAQQRAEQQRLAAANSNPETPVDAGSFIQTLPPSLRRQVLADMDDSQLALLPADLATEAQSLRQELETRHRQIQERFFSTHAGTALSRILRSAGKTYTLRLKVYSKQEQRIKVFFPQQAEWVERDIPFTPCHIPSGLGISLHDRVAIVA